MRLYRNLWAQLTAKGYAAFLHFTLTPFYLRCLGVEAYGLIGFFNTILTFSVIFDLGLSWALNRECARVSAQQEEISTLAPLLRSVELVYGLILGAAGMVLLFFLPNLASFWFITPLFEHSVLEKSLFYMGLAVIFQSPVLLYAQVLGGLQKQILLNTLTTFLLTLRWGGSLLLLLFVGPSLPLFFAWQMVASFLHTIVLRLAVCRCLPTSSVYFAFSSLKRLWPFAWGVNSLSSTGLILMQADKLILSKLVPLETFGYFCVANFMANALNIFSGSITAVYFPRFSHLLAKDPSAVMPEYHRSCSLVALFVFPLGVMFALFPHEILWIWTRNQAIVTHAAEMLRLLMIGSTFFALVNIPSSLQLAWGKTKLIFWQNVLGMVCFLPFSLWFALKVNVLGMTFSWLLITGCYFFVGMPLMHRWTDKQEGKRWWQEAIIKPFLGALFFPLLLKIVLPWESFSLSFQIGGLVACGGLSVLGAWKAAHKPESPYAIKSSW